MDVSRLAQARALLRLRRRKFIYRGNFTFLCADVGEPGPGGSETLEWVDQYLRFAVRCLSSILTACDRLEWTNRRCRKDRRISSVWTYYAGAAIEYWHIRVQTLLDHLASIINRLTKRNASRKDSFYELYKCAEKPMSDPGLQDATIELGADWFTVMRSATWYPTLRAVRNEVVHRGGHTMVFLPPSDGILFQIHKGGSFKSAVDAEPLMLNQNVVFFDRYAAFFLSNVLLFLEDFATTAYARLRLEARLNGTMRHFGFGTLMRWIDSTIEAATQQGSAPARGKAPAQPGGPVGPRIVTRDPPGGHGNLAVEPDD